MRVLNGGKDPNDCESEPFSSGSRQRSQSDPKVDTPFQKLIDRSLPTLFQAITTLCQSAQMVFGIQNGSIATKETPSFTEQVLSATQENVVLPVLIDQDKMGSTQQSTIDEEEMEDALLWMRQHDSEDDSDDSEADPEVPDYQPQTEEQVERIHQYPTNMSDLFDGEDDSYLANYVTPRFSSAKKRASDETIQSSGHFFKTPSKKVNSTGRSEAIWDPCNKEASSEMSTPDKDLEHPPFHIPQNDGGLDSDSDESPNHYFTSSITTLWSPEPRTEKNESFYSAPPRPGSPCRITSQESLDLCGEIVSTSDTASPSNIIEDSGNAIDTMDLDEPCSASNSVLKRFAETPPSAAMLSKTMWEHGPEVIYKDPYFSKDEDVPKKPVLFAGREFRFQKTSDKSKGKGKLRVQKRYFSVVAHLIYI